MNEQKRRECKTREFYKLNTIGFLQFIEVWEGNDVRFIKSIRSEKRDSA